MTSGAPLVEHLAGPAGAFHARPLPDDPSPVLWWFDVDRPAMVLGSRQRDDVVDRPACEAAGIEVVVRRSGGGAVYLVSGDVVWIDVLVPTGHPDAVDDVRASMVRMGECWVDALASAGDTTGLVVHRGGERRSPWSDLVCFAGVGPGEVLRDGHKLVGISQRRTRWGARFQCAVHRRWAPDAFVPLLLGATPPVDELPPVATLRDDADVAGLVAALASTLAA